MIDPTELLAAWASTLRNTPELVAALPNAESIQIYEDGLDANLRKAILDAGEGTVLVAWNGFTPVRVAQSTALHFRHSFSLFVQAWPGATCARLCYLLVEAMPTGSAVKLLHAPIHPGCFPMDLELPSAQRNVLLIGTDGATLDYFELRATLIEIED